MLKDTWKTADIALNHLIGKINAVSTNSTSQIKENKQTWHFMDFYSSDDRYWTNHMALLFISYKFVKGFLAITFLLLVFSNWNFHDVCQRFYNQEQTFSWIWQKIRNLPIDPHYKNCPLLLRHVYRNVYRNEKQT